MTLQKLDLVPEELFVQFEEVPYLVRPKIEYLRIDEEETPPVRVPVLAKQDGFQQLYLKNPIKIFQKLRAALQEDRYRSLSEKQPLVKENKLPMETMAKIFSIFGYEFLHECGVWAGILDWVPERREMKHKLENGVNALFYEDWKELPNYKIDVSNATIIPTNWVETNHNANKTMAKQFDIPENTQVLSNKERVINRYDGLSAVQLGIRHDGILVLLSEWDPWESGPIRGALLGKDTKVEDMVKNFDQSKIKIETIDQKIKAINKSKAKSGILI